jgi:hypothetical protein
LLLWINIPFNLSSAYFILSVHIDPITWIWLVFKFSLAIILLLLTVINQIYFTRPKIKEQFK